MIDTTQIVNIALIVLIAGLLLLLGIGALRLINRIERTPVGQQRVRFAVLEALKPWAAYAIRSAETLALGQITSGQRALTGADKKAIADRFYALLPETLWITGHAWQIGLIKGLITQSDWEQLVQRVFDEGETLLNRNATWLQKQVDMLAPPAPVPIAIKAAPMPTLAAALPGPDGSNG